MKHDYAFTAIVADGCLQGNPKIMRRKNDNCGTQYKCSLVVGEYQRIAQKYDRKVIVYYGASGHGKGLVDAMSAFGVKTPLCRAVVNKDFKFRSSNEICTMLKSQFQGDPQKLYSVSECEDIISLHEEESNPIKLPGCVKNSYHMICF